MLAARNTLVKDIDQISVPIELRVQQARQITKQIAKRGMINAINLTRVLILNLGEREEIRISEGGA